MSRIGGYEILGELGRGSMGVVYEARDAAIGRAVALKVIRIDPGTTPEQGAQLRQRLIREASTAGKIYHPGIVTVHQLGEDGENVFVVMEYVEGASLEHLLRHNPALDRAWALEILRQIADALDYAHKSGVVHRDVKPANILVRTDGRVKVADFGIAKMMSAASEITGTDVSLGSPAYMSPEQVQATQIDGRSDQFALATMAFQMLNGRLPFRGDTAHTVMYQIVTADPFQAQPDDAPIAPATRAVLARALAKSPEDRFPTCASFIEQLRTASGAGVPVLQTSTQKLGPLRPTPRKNRTWILFPILGAILALLLIVGGFIWYRHRAADVTQAPPQAALIKAIADGTLDQVNKLIKPDTVDATNPDGATPLLTAIQYGKVEIVKTLLAKGAKVNTANRDGTTPLMLASEGTAYLPNNAPLVEILLAAHPDIEAQDSHGRTALHRAASEGKIDAVRLLLDHNVRIDVRANDGATPLLFAVEYGKVPVLQLLIERHAQVDLPDSAGNTPLMIASEGTAYLPNNAPMVEALLTAGAHVDLADARGRSAFYRATAEGKVDAMTLLLDQQANINLRANDSSTPMLKAVANGKLAALQLLIDRGADVNLGDANSTPLMIAAETSPFIKDPADFVKLLLAHGAKKNAIDSRGRTALQRAIDSKNTAVIDLLK